MSTQTAIRVCEGKVTYATRGAAYDVVRRLQHRPNYEGVNIYKCHDCRGWHLGRSAFRKPIPIPVLERGDDGEADDAG